MFVVKLFKVGFAQVSEKGTTAFRSHQNQRSLQVKVQEPKQNHKPSCTRRTRRRTRQKRRARLEVALNFFLALKEIKFHQHAESQLNSPSKNIGFKSKSDARQNARKLNPDSKFVLVLVKFSSRFNLFRPGLRSSSGGCMIYFEMVSGFFSSIVSFRVWVCLAVT